MRARISIAGWTLLLALLVSGAVEAGERQHTVASGESISAIAKRYYDDFGLASLLLAYNGRDGNLLHPGETLRIPSSQVHRVVRGDSWSVLSKRYVGNATHYAVVAELNGMPAEKPLQPGDEIVFPVFLEHRLQRGDSLAKLAQLYYGDSSKGTLLQESNRLDDPRRLSVGEVVRVPLLDFRMVPQPKVDLARVEPSPPQPKPEPTRVDGPAERQPLVSATESTPKPAPVVSKPQPPPGPPAQFTRELGEARRLFHAGEFEKARDVLESIRPEVGSGSPASERAEHARLLAFVYVAFDLSKQACEAYGSAATSIAELDPDLVSPRIRNVLGGCSPE